MKKNNSNEEQKISFREKMKDKKYIAKVQLIGYGIFILIIIVYANVSSKNYNYNNKNTIENSKNNPNITSNVEEKSLLETIKDNYNYDIDVTIINNDDTTSNYKYTGFSTGDVIQINTNDKVYYGKSNEYYELVDNNYTLVSDDTIYSIDKKYITLDDILNYIKKSTLDHTTNYSTGRTTSTYYLYLKNILPNYMEADYVEIDVEETDDTLTINIDYTNLMKYKDKNIKSYKVKLIYNNIGKVDNVDINTNTSIVE